MAQLLDGSVMQMFRLTNEPGGLGLSCTPAGMSLAGVPLLRRTQAGFAPRPASEIAALLKAAYGNDAIQLQSSLGVIAQALNSGDFARAMIAAVHTRTPELSREAAIQLANAEQELTKYNPDEPRDWHGRWTRDGSAGPTSMGAPGIESDQRVHPHSLDQRQRVAENTSPADATTLSDGQDGDAAGEPISLERTFEREYDDLGPVDFAKRVIQFGYWLGREGANVPPAERERALAEYSFVQDRLSFWLAYDYKPVTAHLNLLSAALTLYQGAVNGGMAQAGYLPQSMVDVAGAAWAFDNFPPRRIRPSTRPTLEGELASDARTAKEVEGLGGIVNNSEAKIEWKKGVNDQGGNFEVYYGKENPDARRLPPTTTAFDYFKDATGEAISNKTLNTLSVSYIKNPQRIYGQVARYVDAGVDYEPRATSDLDPVLIESKTIQLAIPEYTSPTQWRYLNRAIIYGKENGIKVVITRIRE
jgi:hypothetical protein